MQNSSTCDYQCQPTKAQYTALIAEWLTGDPHELKVLSSKSRKGQNLTKRCKRFTTSATSTQVAVSPLCYAAWCALLTRYWLWTNTCVCVCVYACVCVCVCVCSHMLSIIIGLGWRNQLCCCIFYLSQKTDKITGAATSRSGFGILRSSPSSIM